MPHVVRPPQRANAMRYQTAGGKIYSGLTRVVWELEEVKSGQGATSFLSGSHKAHFDRPPDLYDGGTLGEGSLPEGLINVTPKAGDVVIISESLTHGALPWTPVDRRRIILVLRYRQQTCGAGALPDEIAARLLPEVKELVAAAGHQDVKEIAKTARIEWSEGTV